MLQDKIHWEMFHSSVNTSVEMRRKGKNEQWAAELVHMLGALVKTIGFIIV
jgi:hypothetical protein